MLLRLASLALIVVFPGCAHRTAGRDSTFECGIPIVTDRPVAGRVSIDPALASGLHQQLPGGIAINDGCWEETPEGHLEGTFSAPLNEKRGNMVIYSFVYLNDRWILADTRYELQLWQQRKRQ
jgi:hypothetical protein